MLSLELKQHIVEKLILSRRFNAKLISDGIAGLDVKPIAADGSTRRFFRLFSHGLPLCIGVLPANDLVTGLAEARSTYLIGSHLHGKSLPVPEILGSDDNHRFILFEDCGDTRLYDIVHGEGGDINHELIEKYYDLVIKALVKMQVRGAEEFNTAWCYDTTHYDKRLMRERESGYFFHSCWQDLLGGEDCKEIDAEFEDIAIQAGEGINGLFLHRDFQSRNIMVLDGQPKIIDFQAGRLGPPGYDLASLLIDPYVALTKEQQKRFYGNYVGELRKYMVFSEEVSEPVSVRYGWANNPDDANLYNSEGLPASPFRTTH